MSACWRSSSSPTGTWAWSPAVPGVALAVTAISAAYFIYLAYRIATAPYAPATPVRRSASRRPSSLASCFRHQSQRGYAAMALFGLSLEAVSPASGIAIKILVLNIIIVASNIAWLIAGAAMTRLFRDPRTNRIVNIGFALPSCWPSVALFAPG